MSSNLIPVTILTGFLGSGKTTLLNRILKEQLGKKVFSIHVPVFLVKPEKRPAPPGRGIPIFTIWYAPMARRGLNRFMPF